LDAGRREAGRREIVIRRFGLRHGTEPLSLAEISSELGVTKERIRQLESRALDKLRRRAVAANIECPAWLSAGPQRALAGKTGNILPPGHR
jgi:DNA-directed RNA polymerase sigma subunit (sigma70/sigma32)